MLLERGYVSVGKDGLELFAERCETAGASGAPRRVGFITGPEIGCGRLFNRDSGEVVEVSAQLVWRWSFRDGTKGKAAPVTVEAFMETLPPMPAN